MSSRTSPPKKGLLANRGGVHIRVVQVFKGVADGPLGEPSLSGERLDTVPGANHERVAVAYAKAQDAAVSYFRAQPKPCD